MAKATTKLNAQDRVILFRVATGIDHATVGILAVPVGNLRSEILMVQSAQNWHRQGVTRSLNGTRDRRVLV